MAIEFKTPSQCRDEYLLELQSLKPNEVNVDQTDSDWYIRGSVVGGVVAGVYSDQRLVANDAFPQRARREALGNFLELYLNDTFRAAQPSEGFVKVTGTPGSSIPVLQQFLYEPNGNVYQASSGVDFDAATAVIVPVISVNTGQAQNLLSLAPLTVSSPPAGVNVDASASGDLSDGRDEETNEEAAARILARIRTPIAGGTASDYAQWAVEADPSVVEANVLRFPFGLGTVGVVIAAGTTNIDEALDNGQPVVRIPSQALVDRVQAYLETKRPITDCVTVLAPTGVDVDVTVRVAFVSGDLDTVPAGQSLTQEELVQREVERAIYKTPPGGRQIGASGYVLASEIEEVIDLGLSASVYTLGQIPILLDRQVDDLTVSHPNYPLNGAQVALPGTITVVVGT